MKKTAFYLPFIAFIACLFAACSGNSYTVDGTLKENTYEGKTIYLQIDDTVNQAKYIILDSAVITDNAFKLKGNLKEEDIPTFAFISVGRLDAVDFTKDESPIINVILEPGKIKLDMEKNTFTLSGTPQNDHFNKIYAALTEFSKAKSLGMGDEAVQKQNALLDSVQSHMFSFAMKNAGNSVGEHMIMSSLESRSFLPEQYVELIEATRPSFREKPDVLQISMFLKQVVEQQKSVKAMEARFIGQQYQDIQLMTRSGGNVSLSSYVGKGKHVLLDFWASWCGPCIEEIPNLQDAYAMYKSKGFEIVAISTDQDLVAWHNMLGKHQMPWVQLNDPRGEAGTSYGITSIPSSFLIDPNGVVIAINLRGGQLREKLGEIYTIKQ